MNKTIVFFDLKTTDLKTRFCHLIQLSAVCGANNFDQHVLPRCLIHPEAERLNGFSVRHGRLYRGEDPVETVSLPRLLTSFISFLGDLPRPVLLAAHGARGFDAPVLKRLLRRFRLEQRFWAVVSGFMDTIQVSRGLYPDLRRRSLQHLAEHFLGYDYDGNGPHDAVHDAAILQDLFNWWISDKFPSFQ